MFYDYSSARKLAVGWEIANVSGRVVERWSVGSVGALERSRDRNGKW